MMKKLSIYFFLLVLISAFIGCFLFNGLKDYSIVSILPSFGKYYHPLDHKAPEKTPINQKPAPKEPPKNQQPPPGNGGSKPSNPGPGEPQIPCPGCG